MTQLVLDICLRFSQLCLLDLQRSMCACSSRAIRSLRGDTNPVLLLHVRVVPLPAFSAASLASRDPPLRAKGYVCGKHFTLEKAGVAGLGQAHAPLRRLCRNSWLVAKERVGSSSWSSSVVHRTLMWGLWRSRASRSQEGEDACGATEPVSAALSSPCPSGAVPWQLCHCGRTTLQCGSGNLLEAAGHLSVVLVKPGWTFICLFPWLY